MYRSSRKLFRFVIALAITLVAFGALAWATSGFKQWDAAKWFNYWGKGAPTVVSPAEPEEPNELPEISDKPEGPEEQEAPNELPETPNELEEPDNLEEPVEPDESNELPETPDEQEQPAVESSRSIGSRNAGIVHDSDETVATVEVKRYSDPSITCNSTGVIISGGSTHGEILRVFVDEHEDSALELSYADSEYINPMNSNGFRVPYDVFATIFCDGHGGHLSVMNVGSGEYLDSRSFTYNASAMIMTQMGGTFTNGNAPVYYYDTVTPYWEGCKYIIPIPENASANFGYTIKIVDSYMDTSNTGNEEWFGRSDKTASEAVEVFEDRYEIDLSKVGFADTVRQNNSISYFPRVLVPSESYTNGLFFNVLCPYHMETFAISRLSNPTNVRIEDGYLRWDEVSGAQGYTVFCSDAMSGALLGNTILDEPMVSIGTMPAGQHTFRIRALGNVGMSYSTNSTMELTAYNASLNITPTVLLNYIIDDDTITKFVPHGAAVSDYLYDVDIDGREFGGWYYDSGFSLKVSETDKLDKDTTVYARLSEKQVTERPLTWWERYRWYVLIPCFGVAAALAIFGIVVAARQKRGR